MVKLGRVEKFKIEAPNDSDCREIAWSLIHAKQKISEFLDSTLDSTLNDLELIQKVLDRRLVDKDETYTLQSFGNTLGLVFITNNPGFDWWIFEDEYGRDPVVRYQETSLVFHAQTMISRRVEDQEVVNIPELYTFLRNDITRLIKEQSFK